jgi:hypothetical protein
MYSSLPEEDSCTAPFFAATTSDNCN